MKRQVAVGVVAAALLIPIAASAQAPGGDSVVGGFDDHTTFLRGLFIVAHSGPAGEQPAGTASWHFGGGFGPTWSTRVTCLSVRGSGATIGFSGTQHFIGTIVPVAGLIRVFDGGGPDSRRDSFEWAQTAGAPDGPPIPGPTECSAYPLDFNPGIPPLSVNDRGDLVITDTTAMPTSKDQCKKGGWQAFGVFKNQGDCVSFVATGGKNPPGAGP